MWPGLWAQAGAGGQCGQGRPGERELLCLDEDNAPLMVGTVLMKWGMRWAPLTEHVLTTEHLEDESQWPEGLVLGEDPGAKAAGANLCPGPKGGNPAGTAKRCPSLMALPTCPFTSSVNATGCLLRRQLAVCRNGDPSYLRKMLALVCPGGHRCGWRSLASKPWYLCDLEQVI